MQNLSVPAQQKDRRVEDGTETCGHTMETDSPDANECKLPIVRERAKPFKGS